jgi:hypothetical protein
MDDQEESIFNLDAAADSKPSLNFTDKPNIISSISLDKSIPSHLHLLFPPSSIFFH